MASKFAGKTKADLVAIARISGLLKTTVSQKMTKAELLAFLEEAEKHNGLSPHLAEEVEAAPPPAAGSEKKAGPAKTKTAKAAKEPAVSADLAPTEPVPAGSEADASQDSAASNTEPSPGEAKDSASRKREQAGRSKRYKSNLANKQSAEKQDDQAGKNHKKDKVRSEEAKSSKATKNSTRSGKKHNETKPLNKRKEPDTSPELTDLDQAPLREHHPDEEAYGDEQVARDKNEREISSGILEIMPDGYGFIRIENYIQGPNDLYLPPQYIRRFKLRNGDHVSGPCRQQRDNDRYPALYYLTEVNGLPPDQMINRPHFERLTPIYPDERYVLETGRSEISCRIIDLVSPIGKGQRGMIVSPPKAGKTVLLKKIANAITQNSPDTKLLVLLIDERPEEVTDMQRSIKGEVVYSTFDKSPENHVKITELVLERAKRLVELGEDVVILLDSITRMSRAYNLTINPTGRTLSGGLDPGALYGPKRFFGAARNIENAGSLTIIATALVETGSRMDEVIFEEFKGTGNMEVYLDRKLAEKRIFPAIDLIRSGTRREDLLLSTQELDAVWGIRKAFSHLETNTVTESIVSLMLKTKNNEQFVSSINVSINDQQLFGDLRTGLSNGKTVTNS
ncbi:MAG: transcription termination factor Rho [Eubacteriales bacterium]|nr:transcription termination factor Rho [Eubacteriales bacterium]